MDAFADCFLWRPVADRCEFKLSWQATHLMALLTATIRCVLWQTLRKQTQWYFKLKMLKRWWKRCPGDHFASIITDDCINKILRPGGSEIIRTNRDSFAFHSAVTVVDLQTGGVGRSRNDPFAGYITHRRVLFSRCTCTDWCSHQSDCKHLIMTTYKQLIDVTCQWQDMDSSVSRQMNMHSA